MLQAAVERQLETLCTEADTLLAQLAGEAGE